MRFSLAQTLIQIDHVRFDVYQETRKKKERGKKNRSHMKAKNEVSITLLDVITRLPRIKQVKRRLLTFRNQQLQYISSNTQR